MKTILYVTDFSDNSQKALKFACELSKLLAAEMVALHVYDIPTIVSSGSNAPSFEGIENEVISKNKEKLMSFCKNNSNYDSPPNFRIEVRRDPDTVKGIAKMIDEINPGLVVMGVKGESKLHELLMGSTSLGLIRASGCPVLTVPVTVKSTVIQHIVYASELEEREIAIINKLTEIAGLYDAEITIVHVSTEKEFAGNEKMQWFKDLLLEKVGYRKLKFELLLSNDIHERLYRYLKESSVSMISMLERENKSLAGKILHGDLVKKMEFGMPIHLLSFNEKYLAKITGDLNKQTTKLL